MAKKKTALHIPRTRKFFIFFAIYYIVGVVWLNVFSLLVMRNTPFMWDIIFLNFKNPLMWTMALVWPVQLVWTLPFVLTFLR